ncbi:MAG: hypothetical protein CL910_05845 [Deltaproteobacteria bacterium]|nr:hypothetical protein [Deltaproteobacteria bacterium]
MRFGGAIARAFVVVLAMALLLGAGVGASAQGFFGGDESADDSPFDITADTVEFDTVRQVYVARGNVRLEQPDRVLNSDWMVFSDVTREGVASGNVVVTEGGDRLFADVLHFEVEGSGAIVFDGKLLVGGDFIATGEVIKQTGKQEYVFEEAQFTTCRCPDGGKEPWTIGADTADIEFGGYAVTKSTTFNVLGFPVLWTPRMWFPLKTDRQTGFLPPTFNFGSRNGFTFALPFFWAAHDQLNVTLTPRYHADNGFKPSADLQYVFGESSEGDFYATWVQDDQINENDLSTPFSKNRWGIEWMHDHHLPYGWRWKTEARFVSDNLYGSDFRDMGRVRTSRFVESVSFLENRYGPLGRYGLTAAIHYAESQQNPDDQDRDEFLLQRMPDLRLAGLPADLPGRESLPGVLGKGVYSFDARYTHFWARDDVLDIQPFATDVDGIFADTGIEAIPDGDERDQFGRKVLPDGTVILRDGTTTTAAEIQALNMNPNADPAFLNPSADGSLDNFPGPEGDGKFEEGEPLIDRGHRVVLNPRVAFPFRVADSVEVYPELGWHSTLYQTEEQSGEVRNLFTALVDVRSRFRRELQLPSWLREGFRAVHLMEPRFTYVGVVAPSQSGNPLFIPRPLVTQQRLHQLEPTSLTRDPSDRINDVQAITLALGNRFYIPGAVVEEVVGPPRLLADITLSLFHDFEDNDLSSLYLDGLAYPWRGVRTRFNLGFDLDDPELREALFSIGYATPEGHDIGITYRLVTDVPRFFENFRFDEERFEEFEEGFLEINQMRFNARYAVTRNWALAYGLGYSFEESLFLRNAWAVEYTSTCLCWAFRVEMADDRNDGLEINLQYRILGVGDDYIRPFSRRKRGARDPLLEDTDNL